MNRTKILKHTLLTVFVSILFWGCTPARKAIREPLKEQGDEYLITALKEHQLNFTRFSAKFNATYSKGREETSFSGNLRIEGDKAIWISLTPALGIEAIRALLTPDSVKFINRLKENYLCREFKYLNQLLNKTLDYDMAQAFLIGNDFTLYESNKFKASVDNQEYKLSTVNRMKIRRFVRRNEEEVSIPIQSIWLNPDNFKITKVLIKEAERENRKFLATYDDFKEVEGQLIPSKIKYKIETEQDEVEIIISFTKIQINQEQSYPFRVPENYSEIKDFQPAEK